jgi:YidC/Oxa1 family membrane protein insertase
MEKRMLLALVLSAVIFAIWSMVFPPPAPPVVSPPEASTKEETAVESVVESRPEPLDVPTEVIASALEDEEISASVESTVTLTNDVVEVELSNRGAAVTAMRLLRYDDDEGNVLDLIQAVPNDEKTLPLQLLTDEGPDARLYRLDQDGSARLFTWSDGRGTSVRKRVELGGGYDLSVTIETSGSLSRSGISVGTGLRNLSEAERNSRLAVWGDGIVLADGEVERYKRGKVKATEELRPGILAFAGLEDAYFGNFIKPQTRIDSVLIDRLEFSETKEGEEPAVYAALRLVVVPAAGTFEGLLLGLPKEYNLLQDIGGGVERTLDFGIFGIISVFFLKALWWIHGLVGNYGVAIILLTVGIRIVLFPLMHTSTVSMRKMAKVQPKIKEIQAKYKKKKNDPQARAKMSEETMKLYKAEGVNPLAGCLPLFVQLPILWALYQLFLRAIELRHEPFMLWIQDLSAKDPYYVTPILMTATMWLQQKLAPQTGDPQQQRIMRMLPLVFGIMFLQFPSGLVLYWLTNNVITILQQEITLYIIGERKLGSKSGRKKAK